jgi:polysaccharide pyruvyl transferase WcaK-like protein
MAGLKPYRVGILGSYGGLNLGDEVILQVIIEQLRASIPVEITVFSRNPDDSI